MVRAVRASAIALLLASLGGCGGEPAPGTPPARRHTPSLPPTPTAAPLLPPSDSAAVPAGGYLVWSVVSHGDWPDASIRGAETVWLDSAGREVARRPGVFIAVGARLWQWRESFTTMRGLDCACYHRNQTRDPEGRRCQLPKPVRTIELRELGGGGRVPLALLPDPAQLDGEEPPLQTGVPQAGAGPWLFAGVYWQSTGCGAHGWSSTDPALVDLAHGRAMPPDTVAAPAQLERARDSLQATNPAPDSVESVSLDAQLGWWSDGDTLQVIDRFSTSSPPFWGDEFDSNQRSLYLPRPRPPAALAPWLRPPRAVARYWARHRGSEMKGWSRVDAGHAAALRNRFARG